MENVTIPSEPLPVCNDSVDFYSLTSGNSTDLNCTPPIYPYPDFYVILPIIYSVICAVGLTGNTAVIYVILKAPKMKTVTNMFILNLAIADDLFTLVLPINIAEHLLHYWPFGEVLCKVILSIDHYNIFSSIYFLTVMSIDRYLVVLATVRSKRMPYRTYRAAKIISLCVWILVILIVMPFTVFAGVYVNPFDERKSCVLSFPIPESLWFKASRIYTLILGFAIPVSTICILYTMMLYKLRNMRLNSNAKALDKAKKKVTIMVFIVLAVCLFCWTPFHLSTIVALTTDLRTTPLLIGISYFITSLSYANSCLNPFLYAFLDDSFRKAFKKMLECRPAWMYDCTSHRTCRRGRQRRTERGLMEKWDEKDGLRRQSSNLPASDVMCWVVKAALGKLHIVCTGQQKGAFSYIHLSYVENM